jgi:lysophosphatidate acyltransferase
MTVSGVLLKYVLTPYLASIALLYILSWILPPNARRLPSFFARILASFGCLALAASYGLVSAMLLRLVGKEGLTQWTVAKCFKYLMLLTTGVGVEVVEGAEYLNTRPAVYLGNHQSYVYFPINFGWGGKRWQQGISLGQWLIEAVNRELDILFLGGFFPKWCSVTAKRSLKYTPILGQFSLSPSSRLASLLIRTWNSVGLKNPLHRPRQQQVRPGSL